MCLGRHRYGQCSHGPSHHHLAAHSYPIYAVNWISFSLLSAVRNFLSEAFFLSFPHYLFCSPIWTPLLFFSLFLSLPWSCRADIEQKWLTVIKIRKQGDVRRLLGQTGTQTALVPTASPQQEAPCPWEAPCTFSGPTNHTAPFPYMCSVSAHCNKRTSYTACICIST